MYKNKETEIKLKKKIAFLNGVRLRNELARR
jgi:hypothetical protein